MKILLIGKVGEIDIARHTIRTEKEWSIEQIVWSDLCGPEQFRLFMLDNYDCVILAFENYEISRGLNFLLTQEFRVKEEKIIDFFQYYRATIPLMAVDRVMSNPLMQKYDGLILGLSHAQQGIVPRYMHMNFANLAFSAQDLYYNLKTLEYCLTNYMDKLRYVKYVVIDMYDYSYFNFDTSKVKWAPRYYATGGFSLDPHNFDLNKNYDYTFEQLMVKILQQKYMGISDEKIELWEKIFINVHAYRNYEEFVNNKNISDRLNIIDETDVKDYKVDTGIVSVIHEDTIRENKIYFGEMLKLIYKWNSQMNVYLVLVPRYIDVQQKMASAFEPWKELFYQIVGDARKDYPFTFLDFNGHEISKNRFCYQDASHFNYYGAIKFTELLESYL